VRFPSIRRSWPLALLLVSLGLTAIAAFDAHRAVASHDATVARAMREFSSFAAWSYGQRLEERLSVMLRESLGAVNHGSNLHMQPPVPRAFDLAHNLPWDTRCQCHRTRFGPQPTALFAFELGDQRLDVAVNTHPHPQEGWEVDRAALAVLPAGAKPDYTREDERWILDTITNAVHATPRPDQGFTLVFGQRRARVIAFTLMPTAWGDTMVYGVEYARPGVVKVFEEILDSPGLLPESFTAKNTNREVVVARVADRTGAPLFDSAPNEASPYVSRLTTAPNHASLGFEVFVRPQQSSVLVLGGLPKSHLPFLLGVLGLAAALSVVAVFQIRREMELVRMRSDFVSNVSHELRTPLAQIRLFTETMRFGRARTSAEREWSLAHIDRETTRLGMLVENVLRFGREGSTDPTEPTAVNVASEIERIVEGFRPLALSRRATVVTEVHLAPTSALLRPDALQRIVLNMLDNAVKYGPEGQRITVSVSVAGDQILVSVSDQGPGVTAAERESVWQPFKRGSAAAIAAGSGIGLSVVRDVARQHGGAAWVEDAPGGGARFVVAIPLVRQNGNGKA
jgi:signal transduction histidine kinase